MDQKVKRQKTNNIKKEKVVKNKPRQKAENSNDLSKTIIKIIVFAALLIFLIFACSKAYQIGYKVFADTAMETGVGTDVIVNIPAGASKSEVGEILEYNGLIDDLDTFKIRCILYQAEFYQGTYTLNTSMTTEEILDELRVEQEVQETTTQSETDNEDTTTAEGEE